VLGRPSIKFDIWHALNPQREARRQRPPLLRATASGPIHSAGRPVERHPAMAAGQRAFIRVAIERHHCVRAVGPPCPLRRLRPTDRCGP